MKKEVSDGFGQVYFTVGRLIKAAFSKKIVNNRLSQKIAHRLTLYLEVK